LNFTEDYDYEQANEQFKEKLGALTDDLEKVGFDGELS
jgi:hypothetical protein